MKMHLWYVTQTIKDQILVFIVMAEDHTGARRRAQERRASQAGEWTTHRLRDEAVQVLGGEVYCALVGPETGK